MSHSAPRRPTLLVLHPDPLLRAGLVASLRRHAVFETLVDAADLRTAGDRRIDVVITDYDSAMHLAGSQPAGKPWAARLLILTHDDCEAHIRRALQAGIHGYVMLGSSIDEVIEGVTAVADGQRYVSRSVAQRMADSLAHTPLTAREMEVLGLVVGGACNKAVARILRIQVGTVKSHMTAIMSKLGAASRTQAISIAMRRGLIGRDLAVDRTSPGERSFAHEELQA